MNSDGVRRSRLYLCLSVCICGFDSPKQNCPELMRATVALRSGTWHKEMRRNRIPFGFRAFPVSKAQSLSVFSLSFNYTRRFENNGATGFYQCNTLEIRNPRPELLNHGSCMEFARAASPLKSSKNQQWAPNRIPTFVLLSSVQKPRIRSL